MFVNWLNSLVDETSYGESIENTEFFKENGGLNASDFNSIHSRKHMYNPDTVSTPQHSVRHYKDKFIKISQKIYFVYLFFRVSGTNVNEEIEEVEALILAV